MSNDNQPKEWAPSKTIQETLGVCAMTVWRYGKEGLIKRRRIKRNWFYSLQDAKKMLLLLQL